MELYYRHFWVDYGIDPIKVAKYHRSCTKLPSVSPSIVTNLTLLNYFLILFPMEYIKGIMLSGMNQHLTEGDPHVSEHELIKWLEVWLVMGCYRGNWGRQYWWSKDDIKIFRGAPFCLNEYMRSVRFEKILTRLKYTDEDPPHSVDRFLHVLNLVEAWDSNMSTNFIPGCI